MHCYGCNTSVTKDQERCGSCGFPLKIVSGNCENFADVGAEYQNEWLKYQEEQNCQRFKQELIAFNWRLFWASMYIFKQ